ncbi:glutathione S-transferase family protein [Robiginitomaculum antarcticum]|uniref:glutathione S-transferase family protein n=1 Tax=Robiginitomaculum antarcticum TaxID=437507 RepID=UPI00037F5FBD|nr:glutathione S-transferase family protein [Robiginitomaculum antarcticum]
MLKVYANPFSSPSNKVRYAVSALELEHEFHNVNLQTGEQRSAAFVAVNPMSKVPVIQDGEFTLTESDAILRYLATKHNSDLFPKDLEARANVDRWITFASQHVGQAMGRVFFNRVVCKFLGEEPDKKSLAFGLRLLGTDCAHLNKILETRDYIAADAFSLADISTIAALDPAELAQVDLSEFTALTAWRKRIMAMDFYQNVHSHFGSEMGM